MTFRDLLELGASAIRGNSDDATTGLDTGALVNALGDLLSGKEGKADFTGLLKKMQQNGLGDIAATWLGNGSNAPVPSASVTNILGAETVKHFASRLGLSEASAERAIADALPEMVDKASPGGSLLQEIFEDTGGIDGLIGLARKLF